MSKKFPLFLLLITFNIAFISGQDHNPSTSISLDQEKVSPFQSGYYPLGFFDFDLKYLIKFNNSEGIRLGIGGLTNNRFSKHFKLGGYFARGFNDQQEKYSIGANVLLKKKSNTWLSLYFANDIQEVGNFNYLTDSRIYSVFEPRLVNIIRFYKHRTWKSNLQHSFSEQLLFELQLSKSDIEQTNTYQFQNKGKIYSDYSLTEASVALRLNLESKFRTSQNGTKVFYDSFPKISFQVTQGFNGILEGDFNYTKLGLKFDYFIINPNWSTTSILLEGKYTIGKVPLTHLFHAFPNSPTKETILQRFSVAGRQSFETMFFNEFFSDRLLTLQIKHSLRPFNISEKFKPELAFISRHALGNLSNPEAHINTSFNTLEQLYSESGIELNKLLFGFGLSFSYRYGAYHLEDFDDNIAFKFTFQLKI